MSKQYSHCVTDAAQGCKFLGLMQLFSAFHAMLAGCDFTDQETPRITSACFMMHLAKQLGAQSGSMCPTRPDPVGPSFLSVLQMYRSMLAGILRTSRAGNLRVCRYLAENDPDRFVQLIMAADCSSMREVATSEAFQFKYVSLLGLCRTANIPRILGPNQSGLVLKMNNNHSGDLYVSRAYIAEKRAEREALSPHPRTWPELKSLLSPNLTVLARVIPATNDDEEDIIERLPIGPNKVGAYIIRHFRQFKVIVREDVLATLALTLPPWALSEAREHAETWAAGANEQLCEGGVVPVLKRCQNFPRTLKVSAGTGARSYPVICQHPGCYALLYCEKRDACRHVMPVNGHEESIRALGLARKGAHRRA
jgi:hypothetical protein